MEIIADLHLHSKYSRAVSQQMVIPEIARWGAKKGIGLVGTGDWTHPLWLRELKESLIEVGEGIFRYKNEPRGVLFVLSTEISSIYTQNGKPHRIHNLVLAPSLSVVEEIDNKLRSRGVNLLSDGRPITGLSSIELCELVFSVSEDCLVIPSHAWTPWYSLYGSQSGFDSIDECYQDMAKFIYAIETGLSSSPAMNWRIEELDNRSIVSFSDAHSPQKLGREATVVEIEDIEKLRYEDIKGAIVNNKISYTIEFFPEEGKYHYTGHRNCGVVQSPEETKKLGKICPVCGRQLTVGVMHRVQQLAGRELKTQNLKLKTGANFIYNSEKKRSPYVMLVPLMEILAEALGTGISSQNVENEYNKLIRAFGSEFAVLIKTPTLEIAKISGEKVAEGILRVRSGQVSIEPGYDGVFGTVKIWSFADARDKPKEKQMSLF